MCSLHRRNVLYRRGVLSCHSPGLCWQLHLVLLSWAHAGWVRATGRDDCEHLTGLQAAGTVTVLVEIEGAAWT